MLRILNKEYSRRAVMAMIIIEGMDNTGKTRLTRQLRDMFDLEYRRGASELRGDPEGLMAWVDNELSRHQEKVPLYDRFPLISEEVYGPILRGKSGITPGKYRGWAQRQQVLFIFCRPPIYAIKNWGERGQMEGVIDQADKLITAYDRLIYRYRCQGWGVVRYDYTLVEAFAQVRLMVDQYIRNFEEVSLDGEHQGYGSIVSEQ